MPGAGKEAAADLPQSVVLARRAGAGASALLDRLARVRPLWILSAFVAAEWAATLALARIVAHNGWIYYQGGDQLWYYTTAWLVTHGHMPEPLVGYGWSLVFAPFAAIFGPNLAQALPAIVALQFVVLLPAGVLAAYGIGARLGGRLFGYWVAAVWIGLPFFGIRYTLTGYHQRYVEITLPQGLGLTAMADFPSFVLLAVSAYFLLRALDGGSRFDGLLAGLAAGYAIAIKPSASLFLLGVALALLWSRRWRPGAAVVAGMLPSALALSIWKWRGYGYLPLFHRSSLGTTRLAAGAGAGGPGDPQPVAFLGLHQYIHLDWNHLHLQLLQLSDHFYSLRLVEWTVFAGVIGLLRLSRPAGLLFGGWFFAFVIGKGTFPDATIDDTSMLRLMLGAAPAFVLLVAALPLLLPGVPRRLRKATTPPRPRFSPRARMGLVGAALAVTLVAPAALAAAATPLKPGQDLAWVVSSDVPIPVDHGLQLHATLAGGTVQLTWPAAHARAGRMFYRIFRQRAGTQPDCSASTGDAADCLLNAKVVASTRDLSFQDDPGPGTWEYRLAPSANWLDDVTGGDAYVLSPALQVTVP